MPRHLEVTVEGSPAWRNERTFNPQRLTCPPGSGTHEASPRELHSDLSPDDHAVRNDGSRVPNAHVLSQPSRASWMRIQSNSSEAEMPTPDLASTSFRALSKLTARTRDRALAVGATALSLSEWIDQWFVTPSANVPQFHDVDPALAASALRRHWRLGEQPLL